MPEELGKIERPSADSFEGMRKLFFVPLVYSPSEPPADYVGMLERYWASARGQVRRLADRTAPIRRIFHEGITIEGNESLETIGRLNPRSHALIGEFCASGATVESLEDAEALSEAIDWQRCLMIGLGSPKVVDVVRTTYANAVKARYKAIAMQIDRVLQPGESGILLFQEGHAIQFPSDIQVFYVAPPALDEIHRWIRDREERKQRATEEPQPLEQPAPADATS